VNAAVPRRSMPSTGPTPDPGSSCVQALPGLLPKTRRPGARPRSFGQRGGRSRRPSPPTIQGRQVQTPPPHPQQRLRHDLPRTSSARRKARHGATGGAGSSAGAGNSGATGRPGEGAGRAQRAGGRCGVFQARRSSDLRLALSPGSWTSGSSLRRQARASAGIASR